MLLEPLKSEQVMIILIINSISSTGTNQISSISDFVVLAGKLGHAFVYIVQVF